MQDTLVDIGKKLKKNNIAVDVVGLAAEEENIPKLEAFQVSLTTATLLCQMLGHLLYMPQEMALLKSHGPGFAEIYLRIDLSPSNAGSSE